MFGLGTTEVVVIALLALLFFGKDKLPGLAKGMGESINEFKSALNGESKKDNKKSKTTKEG